MPITLPLRFSGTFICNIVIEQTIKIAFDIPAKKINIIDSDKFNELLNYLFLDDKKDLGDTFGTTGGGISVPVLGRLLCS